MRINDESGFDYCNKMTNRSIDNVMVFIHNSTFSQQLMGKGINNDTQKSYNSRIAFTKKSLIAETNVCFSSFRLRY